MTSRGTIVRRFAAVHGAAIALLLSLGLTPRPAGAQQWTQLGTSGGRITQLAIAPTDPSVVYGGAHWTAINTGLPSSNSRLMTVDAIAVDPANPTMVLAGGVNYSSPAGAPAIARSTNSGQSWAPVTAPELANVNIYDLPIGGGAAFAGTDGKGVWWSHDAGATWEHLGDDAFDPWVAGLVVDPNDTSRLSAVTGQGFFRSVNGGASWARVPLPGNTYPRTLTAGVGAPTTLWLGGSPGVLRSTDGGLTWTRPDAAFNQGVTSIAISRTTPQTMYAGTVSNGVWKTSNGGTSWAHVNNDGGSGFLTYRTVPALAVDPTTADTVYACLDRHAVYKTTNGGTSWENLTEGLFEPVNFVFATLSSIVVNPVDPKTLFAGAAGDSIFGTAFSGVYRSNDGGVHWAKFGSGLEGVPVKALIFDPTNKNRLYVGTQGAGAFRYGPAATRTHPVRERLSRP